MAIPVSQFIPPTMWPFIVPTLYVTIYGRGLQPSRQINTGPWTCQEPGSTARVEPVNLHLLFPNTCVSLNHHPPWKNCLPWNLSLVPNHVESWLDSEFLVKKQAPVQASSLQMLQLAVLWPVLTAFSCHLPVSAAFIKIKLPVPEAQSITRLRAAYWSQLGNFLPLSLWFLLWGSDLLGLGGRGDTSVPVVKILPSSAGGAGLISGLRTKIPTWCRVWPKL